MDRSLALDAITAPAALVDLNGFIRAANGAALAFFRLRSVDCELGELIPLPVLRRLLSARGAYAEPVNLKIGEEQKRAFLSGMHFPTSDGDRILLLIRDLGSVEGIDSTRFSAAAHHVKNALSGVIGFSELIAAECSNSVEKENLAQLRIAALQTEIRILIYLYLAERYCRNFGLAARSVEERGVDIAATLAAEKRSLAEILEEIKLSSTDPYPVGLTVREGEIFSKALLLFLREKSGEASISIVNPAQSSSVKKISVQLTPRKDLRAALQILEHGTEQELHAVGEDELLPLMLRMLTHEAGGRLEVRTNPEVFIDFLFTETSLN